MLPDGGLLSGPVPPLRRFGRRRVRTAGPAGVSLPGSLCPLLSLAPAQFVEHVVPGAQVGLAALRQDDGSRRITKPHRATPAPRIRRLSSLRTRFVRPRRARRTAMTCIGHVPRRRIRLPAIALASTGRCAAGGAADSRADRGDASPSDSAGGEIGGAIRTETVPGCGIHCPSRRTDRDPMMVTGTHRPSLPPQRRTPRVGTAAARACGAACLRGRIPARLRVSAARSATRHPRRCVRDPGDARTAPRAPATAAPGTRCSPAPP